MHELSLCEAIAEKVVMRATGRPIARVVVQVGHLRQVVPDALAFCWTMITDGTELDGSQMQIDQVPAVIVCDDCGTETTISLPILVCGSCESRSVTLISGEELMLVSLELAEV